MGYENGDIESRAKDEQLLTEHKQLQSNHTLQIACEPTVVARSIKLLMKTISEGLCPSLGQGSARSSQSGLLRVAGPPLKAVNLLLPNLRRHCELQKAHILAALRSSTIQAEAGASFCFLLAIQRVLCSSQNGSSKLDLPWQRGDAQRVIDVTGIIIRSGQD